MRWLQVLLRVGLVGVLVVSGGKLLRAQEPTKKGALAKPPWQRYLQGADGQTAAAQQKSLAQMQEAGRFPEALKVAEALAELRGKVQGGDHWQAVDARMEAETIRRVLRQGEQGQKDYAHSLALQRRALDLESKGRYREAQPFLEKVLAVRRTILGEEHPDTGASYNNLALNQRYQGRYPEAEEGMRKALAIWRKALGEEHPDTANCYNSLAANQYAQGKYARAEEGHRKALDIYRKVLGEEHPLTASGYNNVAVNQQAQGKYAEAEEGYRKGLAFCRKLLGEEHPDTATSYNNLAQNQHAQGKYAEAQEGHRKALAIRRKVLGEEHSDTASSYDILAVNQNAQGKYTEAQEGHRKALAIRRKLLGAEHPDTATSYHNLAQNQQAQGKYREAEEGYRKALDIFRKVLGEEHPHTAHSYNNLALNQNAQGKYAQAEEGYKKALAIRRKLLGAEHPDTGASYNNLAHNQQAQGKYAEAEEGFRKALDTFRKVLGEEHPHTAHSYNNLAANQDAQGKYAQAEKGYKKALAICLKVLGAEHPQTATGYNNLAYTQQNQGKYVEAEEGLRKALAIRRKVFGADHPNIARSYNSLACNQNAQGKYTEAEILWLRAADAFTRARLRIAASGLDRATKTGEDSPLPALAAVLARNGKPAEAWQRYEESLARGTWDDLSARLRRPPAQQVKQAELLNRLNRLDQLIENTLSARADTAELKKRREELLSQRRQAQEELDAFARHLEQTYGPAAGQVFERQQIQKSLPADTALLGWLDLPGQPQAADPNGEHWAVLLRSSGEPVWLRLRGSGDQHAWTEADSQIPDQLRVALQSPDGKWLPLARRLAEQRLAPLAKHLDGVRRLVVLPSTALAGVPVEVFAKGYTVSYAPSGTLSAHLHEQTKITAGGLLALADPVFEAPALAERPLPLPAGGVLLTLVATGSSAARAGLRPGDVLVRYNGADLAGPDDFKPLPQADDAGQGVRVTVWREGRTFDRQVPRGKLGVLAAGEPAPQALAQQRQLDRRLASMSRGDEGGKWQQLPGTRIEVQALRRLVGEASAQLLLDSEASEQRLSALAQSGQLGQYRYLHLATHGEVDNVFPLRSAVILSRDRLPDPGKQLEAGLPVYDGRLSAEEVLQQWRLDSELVTLSACQTALGKYEKGEGFVGFAQALLLAGSRSVCLSLWKVDDTATALLMQRFYRNLLGKREGLKGPLGKAEALAEAKAWLRGLSREEAVKLAALLSKGVARGKGRPVQPLVPALPAAGKGKDDCPYAHPYYWAAFVLIGQAE